MRIYSITHGFCLMLCNKLNGKRIDACICLTESFCYTPETNKTSLINLVTLVLLQVMLGLGVSLERQMFTEGLTTGHKWTSISFWVRLTKPIAKDFILFTVSCWSLLANQQLAISMLGKKWMRVTAISQAEENKGDECDQKPGSVPSTGVSPESVFIFNVGCTGLSLPLWASLVAAPRLRGPDRGADPGPLYWKVDS